MVMKSALLEMRLSGNSPWWIQGEMNCLIRLEISMLYFCPFLLLLLNYYYYQKIWYSHFVSFLRPWLMIKVTSGLPNTTDRKLQRELCNRTPGLWIRWCNTGDFEYKSSSTDNTITHTVSVWDLFLLDEQ